MDDLVLTQEEADRVNFENSVRSSIRYIESMNLAACSELEELKEKEVDRA